ncbi:MAG: DUF2804 domain-containing protein [bacterium]
MIEPSPTPARAVDERGEVSFGVFDAPFRNLNLVDTCLRWRGVRLPRRAVAFRLKQWQHFALILPDLFVGVAVVDTGFLRTSWCHVVDRITAEQFEHKRLSPALDLHIARELWDDRTHLHARGYRVDVHNHLYGGVHRVALRIDAAKGKPAVQAAVRCLHDLEAIRPLVVVLPVGPNRGMYSHKVALPLEGRLRVGDRVYLADPASAIAILDIHKAHYPRHTWWNWATGAGWTAGGRSVAFNLTRNVNEDDARYNENGLWVDGVLHHLGPAHFDFDKTNVMAPWRLRSGDGGVDLTFHPSGERAERVNAGVIRSVFHQPYGTFQGTLLHGGERIEVENLFGVCEDHDAHW